MTAREAPSRRAAVLVYPLPGSRVHHSVARLRINGSRAFGARRIIGGHGPRPFTNASARRGSPVPSLRSAWRPSAGVSCHGGSVPNRRDCPAAIEGEATARTQTGERGAGNAYRCFLPPPHH